MIHSKELDALVTELTFIENLQKQKQDENKIFYLYPEEGPYARKNYPKHMDFFNSKDRQILFIAGNRCLTPWTVIDSLPHPQTVLECLQSLCFDVRSWDGKNQCIGRASDVHLKGIEPAFRLLLDNGQLFDCSHKHQLLTSDGYLDISQIMLQSNGLRSNQKLEDLMANYGRDDHQYDLSLHSSQASDQEQLPSLNDARKLSQPYRPLFSQKDVEERISKHKHVYQEIVHSSTGHDPHQIEVLIGMFEDPSSYSDARQMFCLQKVVEQFQSVLPPHLSIDVKERHLSFSDVFSFLQSFFAENKLELDTLLAQTDRQFVEPYELNASQLSDHEKVGRQIFFPFEHPSLFNGVKIIAVESLGYLPILDFHVEEHNNYFCAGIVHHNCGKTFAGAFALSCHLTGIYPHWWRGRRFNHPISVWAAGETNEGTRDIIAKELFGNTMKAEGNEKTVTGTGMIPKANIGKVTWKQGITDFPDKVAIKHISGGLSYLGFKTYGQGRESFQGTALDLIWFDEEPPKEVYEEALTRTATTGGSIIITFTPLKGLSDVVMTFLPENRIIEGSQHGRTVVNMTWDDAPHLDEQAKKDILTAYSPHTRDARSKGIPTLGVGAIYPISEDEFLVDPFKIPPHWPKFYSMDVGWNVTAALWGTYDEASDIIYIYSEHHREHSEPSIHATAIRSRGQWIVGAIDPAARGRSQIDGRDLYTIYLDLGLNLIPANNSVQAGIDTVWERLSSGRLKVFKGLNNFLSEYRVYRRDEKEKIVKKNDHLMDCLRYLCTTSFHAKRINPTLTLEASYDVSRNVYHTSDTIYSHFTPF